MTSDAELTSLLSTQALRFCELAIISQGIERLHRELPSRLSYHNFEHMIDVLNESIVFGEADNLDERSLTLLAIAAVYHDMGFIERGQENEVLGARDAVNAMTIDGGYSAAEIDAVATMIIDTEVRNTDNGLQQVPTTELSKYLCDADVSNLGRPDFFDKAELVRQEIGLPDKSLFMRGVLVFLTGHRWHTPAAQQMRQAQKELNVAEVKRRLA